MAGYLTKTKYLSARQCHKRLWIEENATHLLAPSRGGARWVREQGTYVGVVARSYFPGGRLIASRSQVALDETYRALQDGSSALFEAAFLFDGIYARCDILQPQSGGEWDLVEVKASTRVKPHYLDDVAIQAYVAQGAGVRLRRLKIMLLNRRTCVYPDLTKLFVIRDVTAEVRKRMDALEEDLDRIQATRQRKRSPAIQIGVHCNKPYACPAQTYCWRDVPTPSIFSIPRLGDTQITELVARGILDAREVPDEFPLTDAQRAYIERARSGKAYIDTESILARLATLRYPIYFLDFETHSYAVPRFEGMRPFQQFPFMYSCHVLHEDGRLEHWGFLHMDSSDPRLPVAKALLQHVDRSGSIVVYNSQFERRVLLELAESAPQYAIRLQGMAKRLWDQLHVFRYDYLDPRFEGSSSIKSVVPVLVPELSYDELDVHNGAEAQALWAELVESKDATTKERAAERLRAYCSLDTQAMLEIHRVLQRTVDGE